MGINDDFVDNLINDFLTQVAGNFFETRRQLDHKIEVFHEHVEQLKGLAGKVEERAAFLNYLLVDKTHVVRLYESLSVPFEPFLVGDALHDSALPDGLPGSLTLKGKFIKLVEWAFEQLRLACDVYNNGDRTAKVTDTRSEQTTVVYCALIRKMHAIINDDITRVNCSMSPSCTLQYARSFDLETSDKEKTFGKTSPDLSGLDNKLRYRLIDFDALQIKMFPELPSGPKARAVLTDTARRVYRTNPTLVKSRLNGLR